MDATRYYVSPAVTLSNNIVPLSFKMHKIVVVNLKKTSYIHRECLQGGRADLYSTVIIASLTHESCKYRAKHHFYFKILKAFSPFRVQTQHGLWVFLCNWRRDILSSNGAFPITKTAVVLRQLRINLFQSTILQSRWAAPLSNLAQPVR